MYANKVIVHYRDDIKNKALNVLENCGTGEHGQMWRFIGAATERFELFVNPPGTDNHGALHHWPATV